MMEVPDIPTEDEIFCFESLLKLTDRCAYCSSSLNKTVAVRRVKLYTNTISTKKLSNPFIGKNSHSEFIRREIVLFVCNPCGLIVHRLKNIKPTIWNSQKIINILKSKQKKKRF